MTINSIKQRITWRAVPLVVAGAALVITAAVWAALNINSEPAYGDTPEYWAESKNLKIDSWRTLGYPIVLKIIRHIFEHGLMHPALYLLQMAVAFFAFYYFFSSLVKDKHVKQKTILLALILVITPLFLHYAFSVLTDSLALSFFLIFCTAFFRIVIMGDRRFITLTIAAFSSIAVGFIRLDLLLNIFIIVLLLAFWAIAKKDKRLLVICCTALLLTGLTEKVNHMTQKADLGRPQISISFTMFDRTARTRLPQLLQDMPPTIRSRVSPQMAEDWKKFPNHWATIAAVLSDSEGQRSMIKGTEVAIRRKPLPIMKDLTTNFAEYMLAPLIYVGQSISGQPHDSGHFTYWTNSRMGQAHPKLTTLFITIFITLFALAFMYTAVNLNNINPFTPKARAPAAYWLLILVVAASVHVLQSSIGFHIRYALPIAAIELGFLLWAVTVQWERLNKRSLS